MIEEFKKRQRLYTTLFWGAMIVVYAIVIFYLVSWAIREPIPN